jgi:hypothetical protein
MRWRLPDEGEVLSDALKRDLTTCMEANNETQILTAGSIPILIALRTGLEGIIGGGRAEDIAALERMIKAIQKYGCIEITVRW